MCNHCCCNDRPARMTAKQWMARGYIIRCGMRSIGRNMYGTAVFTRRQVRPLPDAHCAF